MKRCLFGLWVLSLAVHAQAKPLPKAMVLKIAIEAEDYVALHPPLRHIELKRDIKLKKEPHLDSHQRVSGEGYLQMPWNKHHSAGKATYRFRVPYAGIYYVWLRTRWYDNLSNHLSFSVNGGSSRPVGDDGTYEMWHWVASRRNKVRCHAGVNTLTLQDIDMGVRIDQIFLCNDSEYWPGYGVK